MNAAGQAAPRQLKGTTVFSALVLVAIAALASAGVVGTAIVTLRDGYRAIPTRRA